MQSNDIKDSGRSRSARSRCGIRRGKVGKELFGPFIAEAKAAAT